MSNHPTGDTALSRAITTGAPVATNDAQAAELTQKWGEFTTRGSTVYRDDTSYAVCVNPRAATSIARRINAADAMEAENKRLRDALQEWVAFAESAISRFHPDDTVLVEQVKRLHGPRLAKSLAALRGGA